MGSFEHQNKETHSINICFSGNIIKAICASESAGNLIKMKILIGRSVVDLG
jgi:hypothetical protein